MNEMTRSNPKRFREKLLSQATFHLFKKLKLFSNSHQLNSKNNVQFPYLRPCNIYVMTLFPTADGKDGNGLKLGKLGQIFQVLMLYLQKSPK